ncbi:FUSC family protein [Hansschlegelia quercus]|uniref:FUSC family protein n=1 Tax=Hansschlegelia quercus TaxID=2528245 RepID=A0A4Q9GN24_9HYPH|nr:FUSC family protein [Hansschlegelia quercus]TBN51875.1 FUSC family protein [Hansschlegelia quercus]
MSDATLDGLLFAVRTTVAALLAAYVAFLVNLPQASTSMITVFIVSQPLAGMALSKSVYRILGTAVGAVVAVALTAALNDIPEFFATAAALWIGICVAASVYLRDAPASYGALLSGYTVAIIAFPNVDAPDAVFLSALDRAAEITVGIVCATTLSQTLFPKSAAQALRLSTRGAVNSAALWAADTLTGRNDVAAQRDRRLLIARVTKLDALRIHASFDSAEVRLLNRRIRLLHGRLISFIAMLVSTHDRLEALRAANPNLAETLKPRLAQAGAAMADGVTPEERRATAEALRASAPDAAAIRADRSRLIESTILRRVADLVELRSELAPLTPADRGALVTIPGESIARYRDLSLALVAGGTAFAALLATFAFWIGSGWNAGAGAAVQVAVMTSLFAQQDDPGASALKFFVMTAASTVVAVVYAFAVLPRFEGFEMLAVALAPCLFAAAFAMNFPRTTLPGLAFSLGVLTQLGLTDAIATDFASFANNALATLFGIGAGAVMLAVLRPIGSAWPIARLTAGLHRDLTSAFAGRRAPARLVFESRIFDRIDGMMARLDPNDPHDLELERGALAGVRVGLNGLALRRVVRDLPPGAAKPLAESLADLARHFRRLARGERSSPPMARLEAALDAALAADLPRGGGLDETPIWLSALIASLAQHPRMFGATLAVERSA